MATSERTYSDEEVEKRLKKELPHWHLENGWIRRKYKTNSWKGTLMVINTVGHLAEAGQVLAEANAGNFGGDFLELAAIGMARLHIESVGLRRSPGHPEQDAMTSALGIVRQGRSQVREPAAGANVQQTRT
jgi:hypothetical protein